MFPALILVIGLVAAFLFKSHKVIIDAKVILIFTVIELLAIIVSFTELSDSGSLDSVARPDYGEGDETRILQVGHDGQWEDIEIDISEKDMPSGVSGELLSEALEDIQAEYLGDNEGPSMVWRDLTIRDSYQEGRVSAVWSFEPEGYISSDGSMIREAEILPQDVTAGVYLKCGSDSIQQNFPIRVVPVDVSSEDGFRYYMADYLRRADESGGDEMTLPDEIEGVSVSWKEVPENTGRDLSVFGLVVLFAIVALGRSEEKRRISEAREQMVRDYPDIVSGLSLYVGAGFSVKQAFERISGSYESDIEHGRRQRQAGYEEINMLVRQIHGGKSEVDAYEELGSRSGVSCYRKLSMLLCANLRKGNSELLDQLESEEESAFEERKMRARVAGEQASTKLLVPMMGLLFVIMAVLVVPSFMNIM